MKDLIARPAKPMLLLGEVEFTPILVGARTKCSNPYCSVRRGEWRPFDEFGFRMIDRKALRNQPQCVTCRMRPGSTFGKAGPSRKESYAERLALQSQWMQTTFHEVEVWCPGGRRGHWTRRFDMEVTEAPAAQISMFESSVVISVQNAKQCRRCKGDESNV